MIRDRAGLAPKSGCTMNDLKHERRCELAGEFADRHFDLVRWGDAQAAYAEPLHGVRNNFVQHTLYEVIRVILVTTKSGKKGLKVSADVKYGWSTPWKEMDALNAAEYCDFYTDVYNASGLEVPSIFSDSYFRTTRTDWLDAIFQTGVTQDYNFTISGGSDLSTFSIFANWNKKTGTIV